jgi:hypothetical protein
MDKKFWISGIVAAVLFYLLGFLVHGMLLHGEYLKLPNLFRTEEDAMSLMPFMILANLLLGLAFAWIYRQGVSAGASWLQQGIRFGIAVAFLCAVPMYLIYYTVQPWPGAVVVKQIVLETICIVIVGIVVAWLNKSTAAAA